MLSCVYMVSQAPVAPIYRLCPVFGGRSRSLDHLGNLWLMPRQITWSSGQRRRDRRRERRDCQRTAGSAEQGSSPRGTAGDAPGQQHTSDRILRRRRRRTWRVTISLAGGVGGGSRVVSRSRGRRCSTHSTASRDSQAGGEKGAGLGSSRK
jgi:hypothetical protein